MDEVIIVDEEFLEVNECESCGSQKAKLTRYKGRKKLLNECEDKPDMFLCDLCAGTMISRSEFNYRINLDNLAKAIAYIGNEILHEIKNSRRD